jgi:hypothetical protein
VTIRARFEALPQDTKAAILDKYRDWNTEGLDWWENVYSDFTEGMEGIGVNVARIYFSGFWSQGDGACFEGSIEDWALFLPTLYKGKELEDHLAALAGSDSFILYWRHRGHHYHSNSVSWTGDFQFSHNFDSPLRKAVCDLLIADWYELASELEGTAIAALKGHMDDLYRKLEEEYDFLTSDESVIEALIANEMMEETIDEYEEKSNTCE